MGKPLSSANQGWLYKQSKAAWAMWVAWRNSPKSRKDRLVDLMTEEESELIRGAYRRERGGSHNVD